jgi:drug/metabolite transporter (DMT)-like permease
MALTAGIIYGLLGMLGWGVADYFAKKAVVRAGAYRSIFYTQAFGLIPLTILFLFLPKIPSFNSGLFLLLLVGGTIDFVGFIFFYKGLKFEKLSIFTPIVACNPIILIILSFLVLGEVLSISQGIGIAFAIIGLILMSVERTKLRVNKKTMTLGLGAMFSWGTSLFIYGMLVKEMYWVFAILVFSLITFIASILFFVVKKVSLKIPDKNTLGFMATVGILDTLGSIFFAIGVTKELLAIVGPIGALYPAVTLILARMLLKEKILNIQKLGIVGILIGLVVLSL